MEQKVWFGSDWHLGHTNILRFDKRPFDNIMEHDETIIRNYNELVGENDIFYFLGDFALTRNKFTAELYMSMLKKGKKFFIRGNHDKSDTIKLYEKHGIYLGEQKKITVDTQEIVLNHYAMRVWDKSHHGTWHLYGHSHQTLPELENSLSFDVGINGWNYKPISFNQIKEKMATKKWKAIDHHTGRRD